jgi:tetratricopeptide (TPR) repeat protein
MHEWEAGQLILGEYVVEKQLGEGGMGRVCLVKSNSTGRRFAVKQTKLKDEKSRKAFLAELQTWIDLPEHPNILPCRFFRTVGDEIVIFTDYIEGGSLKNWIEQGKLTTLEQILDVAIQFAWGLHAIHERGLIHQDVKPENVLMMADGTPMVADFGLARARQVAPDGEYVSPTQLFGRHSILVPGAGVMTKQYASPEQKAGQPLSRKTDIWSWGVSILDIFMGGVSCPHGGHIAAEVLVAFLDNGGQVAGLPKMPEELVDILRKCFARDPTKRWVDLNAASSAVKDLFKYVTGRVYLKQVQQGRTTPADAVRHDRQGKDGARWNNPREWLRKAYAINGRDPAEADTYEVPAAYSRKGATVADLAIFEEAERQFKAALSVWNSIIAKDYAGIFFEKARIFKSLDDAEGGLAAADKGIAIYRRLVDQEGFGELACSLAGELQNKATSLKAMGDLGRAEKLYDESIVIFRRLVEHGGQRDLANNLAMALMNKANAFLVMGDISGAMKLYSDSIVIYRRLIEHEGRPELANDFALALINKASALMAMGDLAGAVKLYNECIAIYRRLVEEEGRRDLANALAMALQNKANAINGMGDLPGAVKLYGDCIAIYRRLVEDDGRWDLASALAMALMNMAIALYRNDDLAGAVKLYDECIAIYRRLVEEEGRRDLANDLAMALLNEANAFTGKEDWAGAVQLYDDCIAIRSRLVENEGRQDLLGDLCWAQLLRATVMNINFPFSEKERRQARVAYRNVVIEARRTGRADLKQLVEEMPMLLGEWL